MTTLRTNYPPLATKGAWQKPLGTQPTLEMLATAEAFAARGVGKQALAHAMSLRPEGVTIAQMRAMTTIWQQVTNGKFSNGAHRNHIDGLIKAGYFSKAPGNGFALAITDKGRAYIKLHTAGVPVAAPVKPVKVTRTANKKPAPAPKADTPVSDQPPAPVTTEAAQA